MCECADSVWGREDADRGADEEVGQEEGIPLQEQYAPLWPRFRPPAAPWSGMTYRYFLLLDRYLHLSRHLPWHCMCTLLHPRSLTSLLSLLPPSPRLTLPHYNWPRMHRAALRDRLPLQLSHTTTINLARSIKRLSSWSTELIIDQPNGLPYMPKHCQGMVMKCLTPWKYMKIHFWVVRTPIADTKQAKTA